jgi:hypothetical protein
MRISSDILVGGEQRLAVVTSLNHVDRNVGWTKPLSPRHLCNDQLYVYGVSLV